MADFPSLPIMTDAYLGDAYHLSTEEHGAYFLLLMAAWRSPGCRLRDDDKFLAKVTRSTVARWQHKLRQSMLEFWSIKDGFWFQKRLLEEHNRVQAICKKRSQVALRRWSANQLKTNGAADTDAYANDMHARGYHTQIDSSLRSESSPAPTQDSLNLVSEHPPLNGGDVKPNGHHIDSKRGTRLTEDWTPSSEAVAHCKATLECSTSLLKQEFPNFQCHFLAATGTSARKIDWDRTFINWMRRARRDEVRYEQLQTRRTGSRTTH